MPSLTIPITDEYDDPAYFSAPHLSVHDFTHPQSNFPTHPDEDQLHLDLNLDHLPPSPPHPQTSPTTTTSSSEPALDDPPSPLNYFIHNGYRYDGDLFKLRPPQERTIASRPERVLEHKPPLLSNRQTFNRVYSEGTYKARPSSLRQPRRSSSRFSATSLDDISVASHREPDVDRGEHRPTLPVIRPPSVRPLGGEKGSGLVRRIEMVRQSAGTGDGNHNLQGLLAYSAVPVTKIPGERPGVKSGRRGGPEDGGDEEVLEENLRPNVVREKRGRSYTSFAKNTPYGGEGAAKSGRIPGKRPFWRGMLHSR